MLYRLIKETGEIDKVNKPTLWSHLKYYYDANNKFRKETNKLLYIGGVIDTPLYKFSQLRDKLEKEL